MRTFILAVGFFALISQIGCNNEHANGEAETTFPATSPLQKDTSIVTNYVCQIRAIQHIEIRALEKGYLEKTYVDEGQYVQQGQTMFQIMPAMYKAELQKAQAETNFAEIEYENTKSLAENKIVSKNELALALAKLNKAKAEQSLAQVHLGFTQIKAPFSGIMDHFQVRLGSLVNEGDLLTTMSDNSQMWVYFNVPEAQYLNFKTKLNHDDMIHVRLLMANGDLFEYPGTVQTIEADFNNETGNIAFRATFPNPKGLLRHGGTGNVQVTTPLKNAMIIPQKATFEVLDKKYVYVIDKNNVVRSRMVVIGHELPHLYEALSGLDVKDKILLEGLRKVKEGQKIAWQFKDPKWVLNNLGLYAE